MLRKNALLWTLAALVTVVSAFYQRVTGPTYPRRGEIVVEGEAIRYRLPRSADTSRPAEIALAVANARTEGYLQYKRYGTGDPWTQVALARGAEGRLTGDLPLQPAAGKVAYQAFLSRSGLEYALTPEPLVLRYKDPVPGSLLILHVLVMFGGMLTSTAAGFAALGRRGDTRRIALVAAVLILVGGFALGPLVQKAAFGVYWSGFPFGHDLTDNKTVVSALVWIAALVAGRRGRDARGWVVAASLVTLAVFLIPHSLLGSELKYSQLG